MSLLNPEGKNWFKASGLLRDAKFFLERLFVLLLNDIQKHFQLNFRLKSLLRPQPHSLLKFQPHSFLKPPQSRNFLKLKPHNFLKLKPHNFLKLKPHSFLKLKPHNFLKFSLHSFLKFQPSPFLQSQPKGSLKAPTAQSLEASSKRPLKPLLFLFLFPMFVFAKSVDSRSVSQSVFNQKPTVCSVTINSSEEKEVFKSYLGEDFNFVELTEYGTKKGAEDWFIGACNQGVECDILVVSGHFGGSFFGTETNYRLGLTELSRRSCQRACDGILKKPREVFLFGCNTTAGKSQDHRTPEEYTEVLMSDGFSRRQAEQISAFRYSPIGEKTKDRMRQVFPYSRIYGFHSQAPSGKNIVPRLKSYFESVGSYKAHLEGFPTREENGFWSSAMKGQWIRSVDGDGGLENPVCVLEEDLPIYKKLSWVEEVLSDREKSLAYIPVIDVYLRDLERRFGVEWEGFPSEELSLMERIQYNELGRMRVEEVLERPIEGVISAQVEVLNFGKRVGWYDEEAYRERLRGLIGGMFKENLDWGERDFICSLGVEMDLRIEDLPEERWNKHTISAIGCVKPRDSRVHLVLVELLKDPEVRSYAAKALGEIGSADPQVLLALTTALKEDTEGYVRDYAAKALGEIGSADPQVLSALTTALEDTERLVRRSATQALAEIESA